jgi:plastocyanin
MAPTTPKTTPSTTPSGTSGTSVKIVDYAFQPDPLTVSAGTTVTWTNNGAVAHTVTGTGWGSSTLQPGSTYTYTFNTPGVYPYHCSIHPTLMNGTVTVTGAGATGTTTTPTTPTGY